jgi:hypothetical protein
MALAHTLGWGLLGSATTMVARSVTRRAMHYRSGTPRLPRAARRNNSFTTMLVLAAAAGAMLALGDVMKEQQKHVTHATG